MEPEVLAERALRGVVRGDAIIVVPRLWKASWYLERLSPKWSMRFIAATARSAKSKSVEESVR